MPSRTLKNQQNAIDNTCPVRPLIEGLARLLRTTLRDSVEPNKPEAMLRIDDLLIR